MNLMQLGGDADFSLMPGLFEPEIRPHVRAFGRFVRLADGLVDDPRLTRADKVARLEDLEAALDGGDLTWSPEATTIVRAFRDSLHETGVSPQYARRLLGAFRGDAAGRTHRTWSDLLVYCGASAAPIGRHMLELLKEDADACGPPSDAGCAALHILKRLRDFRTNAHRFHRLCIPEQFMEDAMVSVDQLQAPTAKGQTRAVIDRVLDGVDGLITQAGPLTERIASRGLKRHTAIVLCRARKLAFRFRETDPLQYRVELSQGERRRCVWTTVVGAMLGRI